MAAVCSGISMFMSALKKSLTEDGCKIKKIESYKIQSTVNNRAQESYLA